MYVCLCHAVTEHEIRSAADAGHASVEALGRCLGVATGCGQCACMAEEILDEHLEPPRDRGRRSESPSLFPAPAPA
ncbi:MAG: (2Fe-2S)-binding protein [Gammaproteobacteria bacterium]